MTSLPEDDDQLLEQWLAVIGMVVVHWSAVERSIDQCVHFLCQKSSSRKPTRLSGKLDLIAKQMSSATIAPADFVDLKTRTKESVQIRDVLVHGIIISYDREKMSVGKVKGASEVHLIEEFLVDRSRLDRSMQSLLNLQKQWSSIAWDLLEQK